ncbi:MAG: hypothetical protein M0C28_38675 [Candidatus Moduliflexus flocculans]|nr:hypothetical protein [Candidatus Moduliflexus flocculans]
MLVNPRAESAVRQGVTTLVSGQCGGSPFPLTDEEAAEMQRIAAPRSTAWPLEWKDIRGFLARDREARAPRSTTTTFVGNGTVRAAAMGYDDRPATAAELDRMRALVAEAMAGGALGLSSGLEYTPSSFASTEELIELSRVAAGSGGVYATHMRDEEASVLEAVAEALRIAREAPIRLQISHLKIGVRRQLAQARRAHGHARKGPGRGLDFRCDRYPYIAGRDEPGPALPALGARGGHAKSFVARLKDPALRRPPAGRAWPRSRRKATARGTTILISDGRPRTRTAGPRGHERPRGRGQGGQSAVRFHARPAHRGSRAAWA